MTNLLLCLLLVIPNIIANAEDPKPNTTIADLVQLQTDQIKKIVADQQVRVEYPVITKLNKEKDIEKFSLEELKAHCAHLSKLLNANRTELNATKPLVPINYKRPVYVQKQPSFVQKYPTNQRNNGFYLTTQASTTKKPTTLTQKPIANNNVKYIRLEPVILQKTILNDGRTIYYWHKSLPSTLQYPQGEQINKKVPPSTTIPEKDNLITTPATTSYNSYDFRNFFPLFYGSYKQDTTSTTTTTELPTTTSTTTTTTQKPTKPEDLMYAHQLRFVVPLPFDDKMQVRQGFDPYAYYPKELQPSTINVQVPYSPNYSMIKSVAIPNRSSLDNVDV